MTMFLFKPNALEPSQKNKKIKPSALEETETWKTHTMHANIRDWMERNLLNSSYIFLSDENFENLIVWITFSLCA